MNSTLGDDVKLPVLVRALVDAPYAVKVWSSQHPVAWRYYTGACRRFGWSAGCLGWHTPRNGPFAGIRIEALHPNHLWAAAGLYEPAVSRCVIDLLSDVRIAAGETWDVGANRGLMSLLAAKHGAARVVAIELAPGNIVLLERERAANPAIAARIEVIQAAAADSDRDIVIVIDTLDGAVCQIEAPGVEQYERTEATRTMAGSARAIDSLVGERQARVGLLKIDVEGAEALVLAGAAALLRDQSPAVVVEIHNEAAGRRSVDLLTQAGYDCRRLEGDGTLTTLGDVVGYGHIVARRAA